MRWLLVVTLVLVMGGPVWAETVCVTSTCTARVGEPVVVSTGTAERDVSYRLWVNGAESAATWAVVNGVVEFALSSGFRAGEYRVQIEIVDRDAGSHLSEAAVLTVKRRWRK